MIPGREGGCKQWKTEHELGKEARLELFELLAGIATAKSRSENVICLEVSSKS